MSLATGIITQIPFGVTQTGMDATTLLVDAAGEAAAFLVKIQRTGNLYRVGFKTSTVTGAQTIRVSFQGLTGAGVPNDTVNQFRDVAIADTDDNLWKETGIISSNGTDGGSLRAVNRGDYVAVVFDNPGWAAGQAFTLTGMSGVTNAGYSALKTSGSWNKQSPGAQMALYYDDNKVYYLESVIPATNISSLNFSTSSAPSRRGLHFRLPFPARIMGCLVVGAFVVANATAQVVLYDAAANVLQQSAVHDADFTRSTAATLTTYYFPSEQTLAANTDYYVMLEALGTISISLNFYSMQTAALLDQLAGGQNFCFSELSGTTFTDTTTRRPLIYLMVSALDDGAGSSPTFPPASKVYAGTDRGDGTLGTLHASNIATAAGTGVNLTPSILLAGNTVDDVVGAHTEPVVTFPAASKVYAGTDRGDGTLGTLHASNIAVAAGAGVNLTPSILLAGNTVDDVTGTHTEPVVTFPPASKVYAGADRGDGVVGTLHASNIAAAAGSGVNLTPSILLAGNTVDDVTGTHTEPVITFPPASKIYAGTDRGDGTIGTLHASNIATAAGAGSNLAAGDLRSGVTVDDVAGSLVPTGGAVAGGAYTFVD